MERLLLYSGALVVTFGALLYAMYAFAARRQLVAAGAGNGGATVTVSGTLGEFGAYGDIMAGFGFVFLTGTLILRAIATGHGPFSNMYEFSISLAWGIIAASLYFQRRYRMRALGALVLPWAVFLLWYATTVPSGIQPLVPALQNNLLLTVHVVVAIIAYGTFAVGFGSAVLFLIQQESGIPWLPSASALDEVGYRATVVGFPFMALVIILGAVWADVAWGTYWSWDPKETASLVTWLIYGGYLHARALRGWRGTRSAVLLLVGFAATLLTYFGNLFFGGLHSYAGV